MFLFIYLFGNVNDNDFLFVDFLSILEHLYVRIP